MALGSIAFKYKRTRFQDPVNPKVILKIDATTNLDFSRSASLSKYPIEDGSEISDHYTLGNKTLSVQGVFSNTPLEIFDGALNVATGIIPNTTVRVLAGAAVSAGQLLIRKRRGPRSNPAKRAYNYLNELMDKKIPFTFTTKYESFKNMLITSLNIPRDGAAGDSLPFRCEMEQVKIVQAKKGDVNAYLDSINGKSAGKFDAGKQTGINLGSTDDNRSILAAIVDTVRGK